MTAVEVRRLAQPGLHSVGEVSGLCLKVKKTGARSWILRTTIGGRRVELGLGGYPTVTLATAREHARELLDQIRRGADPSVERRARRVAVEWTFRKAAEGYIEAHRPSWKNARHADQWANTLATYAYPLFGDKAVSEVDKADVLAALEPIWTRKHETATRLRGRIELVLSYAVQRELRPEGLNPARWRGNLDAVLAKGVHVAKVRHHAALAIDEMSAFMRRLRAVQGMGAAALRFAILTAARSGEVRGATWTEIDLANRVWTIPAARMKAGREHRVPLSDAAAELLQKQPRFEGCELVFPGAKGKPISDMTLTACLRRMDVAATAHGFRSTFRDWCAERTSFPGEVAEMALAHAVGNAVEAAYRRGDLFEKRRELMQAWAKYVDTRQSPRPSGRRDGRQGSRARAGSVASM
jgi:integrase